MIRIELPHRRGAGIQYGYSAFVECVLSLHVAFHRGGHPFAESRLRGLRRLDADLRRRIEELRPLFEADQLDALFAWPLDGPETFEAGLTRMSGYPSDLRSTLADYWHATFAGDWLRIEPRLADAVDEASLRLAERGFAGVLGKLPPGARAHANVLTVESAGDVTIVPTPQRPLRLSPSMFVWRRLLVATAPEGSATVLYTAPAANRLLHPDAAPSELVETLSALADDTRLRVLKLIALRPRTAQELAPIIGMSTTGMSKILRKFADAGLVEARREGYYVVYSLNAARIRTLPIVLEEFLGGRDSRAA